VPSPLPIDLVLTPIDGEPRTLGQWLTTFHLASVVVDPYTNESAWVLDAAARILHHYRDAAVRTNFVVTSDVEGARQFTGALAQRYLVLTDPDRAFVKAVGLERLPAFVFVRQDATVPASAQGWSPAEWRAVSDAIAATTSWSKAVIPAPDDPTPFHGSPALG